MSSKYMMTQIYMTSSEYVTSSRYMMSSKYMTSTKTSYRTYDSFTCLMDDVFDEIVINLSIVVCSAQVCKVVQQRHSRFVVLFVGVDLVIVVETCIKMFSWVQEEMYFNRINFRE